MLPWRAVETSARVRRWREVSSACSWHGGAGDPSGRLMGVTCPSRASCLRWAARGCAAATYNRGERGPPCAKPELTGNDGDSHPLYRTLHCSPVCRRDTQRRAAGPNPSAAMHLSTQFLSQSVRACRTLWRSQETPDTQAPALIPRNRPPPSGQARCLLSSGPG